MMFSKHRPMVVVSIAVWALILTRGVVSAQILPPYDGKQKCATRESMECVRKALPKSMQREILIVVEAVKLVDLLDPPHSYPLVGPAQLHHVHWKYKVAVVEPRLAVTAFGLVFPVPRIRCECVYIDRDHLHALPQGNSR